MTCSSSRIDLAARRLLSSIAGTRDARVSAVALAHMRGAGKTLIDKYGDHAQEARRAEGKDTGTVRLQDGPVTVVAELPKRVDWDQAAQRIRLSPTRARKLRSIGPAANDALTIKPDHPMGADQHACSG
ncbi:hypothetical protein DU478_00595 [Thalassococcus profundi]|uniref:Uncharacterized protein n=1 Tax=Thalassococcus profundi TaxID=2282382 RepID=A0A369TRZ3_9RHOB|nr:hypothetical protein [Thalassococcus profundi]RDD68013.1 hypothetical protein DU478_00595 [Thalassococcus profundi]